MYMRRCSTIGVLLVMGAGRASFGQDGSSPSLVAAIRGKEIVDAAAQAMGGGDALRALKTVSRTMSSERADEGQGGSPVTVSRVYDRIGASPRTVNRSKTVSVRDFVGNRLVDDLSYDIYGGQRVSRRTVVAPNDGFTSFAEYVYHAIRPIPAAGLARSRAAALRRYPETLILAALARPDGLRYLGATQWEGRPHDAVSFTDADGTLLTLVFDRSSHLLSKVESLAEDGVLGDIPVEVVYEDYRSVGRLRLPYRIVDRRGGVVLDDNRVSSTLVDATVADSLFVRPAGYEELDFGKPFPNLVKLGDDSYAMLGGYNSIFVIMNDFVVVIEAGGSSRESETTIAKIKELAPGKPIRYLVATHWNYDHLGGVRPYVAEGATIIAPPSAAPVIERAVASARPLHPDALSRKPRAARIETLHGKERTITDGRHRVVVYDISPSPHVDQMLVAYLSDEKTLLEADALDIVVPGHVGTAGDDTADLAAKIERLGLAIDRIVPVHGQIGTMEDLRQALARRSRLSDARY